MQDSQNAAYSLVGRVLNSKWSVTKLITKDKDGTGGNFSVCYEVVNGQQIAFLKALNIKAFFQMAPNRPVMEVMLEQSRAYEYEKDVLNRCKDRRLSKVATIIDEGNEVIEGFVYNQVPYLVFEMANGDLRSQLKNYTNALEAAWKLRSLHNIAVGMKQLHSAKISHQDLKPSNVLIFEQGATSKVGDLGRALCQDILAPHDVNGGFAGDRNYAPPEAFYGHIEPDWQRRIQQVDLYMFGNLATFYFSGVTLTALIFSHLEPRFYFMNWHGTYADVKAYLLDAYYRAMQTLDASISGAHKAELLALIDSCSHADPEKRGLHHKSKMVQKLPFEVVVSKLNLLASKAEYGIL